jgi:hypothetical protein
MGLRHLTPGAPPVLRHPRDADLEDRPHAIGLGNINLLISS